MRNNAQERTLFHQRWTLLAPMLNIEERVQEEEMSTIAAPLDGIDTRLLSDVRMHIEIARKCRLDRLDPAMPRETPIEIQIAVLRFLADEG